MQGVVEEKKGRYPHREAQLIGSGDDLSKQWFVSY